MYSKVAQIKDVATLQQRIAELGWELPADVGVLRADEGSPLAVPYQVGEIRVGNRWCIHPMEGWDAQRDGSPSEHTLRRWRHFGLSGAKLIWGGEAAAVQEDGRANPRQTLATPHNEAGLAALLSELEVAHRERFGTTDDLLVGLQLTHSGRFSRPNGPQLEPRIAYHHPLLDQKYGIDPSDTSIVWTDAELECLIDRYVDATHLAWKVGFRFVDVKACHGYLLHEFLSARDRPGKFGGDLAGRSRVMMTIVERIRSELPDIIVGVRLSAFDSVPYQASRATGQPMAYEHLLPYEYGFGLNPANPLEVDLGETIDLVEMLRRRGVRLLNVTCGSPYYNPHLQRPAIFPPSDGYLPPEDPLVGVCRHIDATRQLKLAFGDLGVVGTGYTYLQDFLPQVAQGVVRQGWTDFVGLGRMVLSYPELPADTLETGSLQRKRICRTFSDCTTAPRNGMVSGCYPLDEYYKQLPESAKLREIKQRYRAEA